MTATSTACSSTRALRANDWFPLGLQAMMGLRNLVVRAERPRWAIDCGPTHSHSPGGGVDDLVRRDPRHSDTVPRLPERQHLYA